MTNHKPTQMELIGRAFHKAALRAEAIADAIPEDADAYEEGAVLEAVYVKANLLADFIVSLPAESTADRFVKARAEAWIAGHYWPKDGAFSAPVENTHEHHVPTHGAV